MRTSRGFTLIELLVVIAVIAILAAIVFPVLSAAKETGRISTCTSNLKQLGIGMRLYADDWFGHLPRARVENGGDGNPSGNWAGVYHVFGACDPKKGQIYPYLRTLGVYMCPSARGARPKRITDPSALPYPLSYSMNNLMDYRTVNSVEACNSRVGLLIHEDTSTIDDGDFYWLGWTDDGEGQNRPAQVHNGGTCIVYVDMHAKWQSYESAIKSLRRADWDPDKR